jgi:hypothetical protein
VRHARDVKATLTAGEPVPAQYVEVIGMNKPITPINPA